jgi:hypothetical protein
MTIKKKQTDKEKLADIKEILELTDPDDPEALNMAIWQIESYADADMGCKLKKSSK